MADGPRRVQTRGNPSGPQRHSPLMDDSADAMGGSADPIGAIFGSSVALAQCRFVAWCRQMFASRSCLPRAGVGATIPVDRHIPDPCNATPSWADCGSRLLRYVGRSKQVGGARARHCSAGSLRCLCFEGGIPQKANVTGLDSAPFRPLSKRDACRTDPGAAEKRRTAAPRLTRR